MPRIIMKCPFIRGGSQKAVSHLRHYINYVATRSGVEKIQIDKQDLPATKKQKEFVSRIIKDFPLSKGMFEYEDFLAKQTRGNASEFISRAVEDNYDKVAKLENYMQYIALRPGAEKIATHGLFTASDERVVLSQIADIIAHHKGNVWLPIISLRREDAQRLGYDNVEQWQSLLRSCAMEVAQQMRIPSEQFRWYAAFHNESSHPHIHMVCYSEDGKSGFLTTKGIENIKSTLAKEIFRQELTEIYAEQTIRRNRLTVDAEQRLKELIEQMQSGEMESSRIEQLMEELSLRLQNLSGKKQYGYLKAPLKSLVDEIVDELAKDERIKKAYELWYEMREEVLRTYGDNLPERLPLSQQKELKRIKNAVIEEAMRLGTQGSDHQQEDTDSAKAATESQQIPQEDVSTPDGSQQSESNKAHQATTSSTSVQRSKPWIPRSVQCATRLLRHMSKIFEDNPPPRQYNTRFTDRKLLQKIQEQKIAHGHKADDHEDQSMSMQ